MYDQNSLYTCVGDLWAQSGAIEGGRMLWRKSRKCSDRSGCPGLDSFFIGHFYWPFLLAIFIGLNSGYCHDGRCGKCDLPWRLQQQELSTNTGGVVWSWKLDFNNDIQALFGTGIAWWIWPTKSRGLSFGPTQKRNICKKNHLRRRKEERRDRRRRQITRSRDVWKSLIEIYNNQKSLLEFSGIGW